ncbi:MAG: hypothetical protein QM569_03810 [Acidovorax sp.]|uniref:hypothetical protein n=1 Tax=Acidovorax sp. TaxID=1872122 RepID=UPI0039E4ED3C
MKTPNNAAQAGAAVRAMNALNMADMKVQDIENLADATVLAVRAMLAGPDSGAMRVSVMTLVEHLADETFRAMNDINSRAEDCGCQFTDEQWHSTHKALCDAVRAKVEGGAA